MIIDNVNDTIEYAIVSGMANTIISIIGCIKLDRVIATIPHISENSKHI